MATMQSTPSDTGAASATTLTTGATGTCHGCHQYVYRDVDEQPDGRWLCGTCRAEAAHIAGGGTVEWVPCGECNDLRRPVRTRCPGCGGLGKVKRFVPAPACASCGAPVVADDDGLTCSRATADGMPCRRHWQDGDALAAEVAERRLTLAELTIIECGVSPDEAAMLAAGGQW